MSRDFAIIIFSSLLAMLNPSLLAAVTVMLLLPNPKRLMLGYLLGAYTTSFVAGFLIVFSLHASGAVKSSNSSTSPGEDIAIGLMALTVAFVLATGRDARLRRWRERRKEATPARARGAEPGTPWHERLLDEGIRGHHVRGRCGDELPGDHVFQRARSHREAQPADAADPRARCVFLRDAADPVGAAAALPRSSPRTGRRTSSSASRAGCCARVVCSR